MRSTASHLPASGRPSLQLLLAAPLPQTGCSGSSNDGLKKKSNAIWHHAISCRIPLLVGIGWTGNAVRDHCELFQRKEITI